MVKTNLFLYVRLLIYLMYVQGVSKKRVIKEFNIKNTYRAFTKNIGSSKFV